jgi:hypothetical protein
LFITSSVNWELEKLVDWGNQSTNLPFYKLQTFRYQCSEVSGAAGITPFIIVPGDNFNEVALFLA